MRPLSLRGSLIAAALAVALAACTQGVVDDVKKAVDDAKEAQRPSVTAFRLVDPAPAAPYTNGNEIRFELLTSSTAAYWIVNESATAPAADSAAWKPDKPSSYDDIDEEGEYRLYAWAKSSAGSVSAKASPLTAIVDRTAPRILSFALGAANPSPVATKALVLDASGADDRGADDGSGLWKWFVSETQTTTPSADDSGWVADPGSAPSFSSGTGEKTLRAWVSDRAGNVSAASTLTFTYLDPDENPVVTAFSAASADGDDPEGYATTRSLSCGVTISSASRYYLIRVGDAAPAADQAAADNDCTGWISLDGGATAAPTFTLPSVDGSYTLGAWAKDSAGQVSLASISRTVFLDREAPEVTTFALKDGSPNPTSSRTIQIDFDEDDGSGSGVDAWLVNESATAPAASSSAWLGARPSTYVIAGTGDGSKTIYAWVKDGAGNVGLSASLAVYIHETAVTASLADSVTLIAAHEGVRITFSEAMSAGTLAVTGDFAAGTATWSGNTLTWKPTGIWPAGTPRLTVNCSCSHGMAATALDVPVAVFKGVCVSKAGAAGVDGGVKSPLSTIQAGIDKAKSVYVDAGLGAATVRVAYCEEASPYYASCAVYNASPAQSATYVVNMVEGISVYGRYAADFSAQYSAASGYVSYIEDTSTTALYSAAGEMVVYPVRAVNAEGAMTSATVLDGFTITMGYGGGSGTAHAAVYCGEGADPTLQNLVVRGAGTCNSAYGVVLCCSDATISACTINAGIGEVNLAGIQAWATSGHAASPTVAGCVIDPGQNTLSTGTTIGIAFMNYITGYITGNEINGGNFNTVTGAGACIYLVTMNTTGTRIGGNRFYSFNAQHVTYNYGIYVGVSDPDSNPYNLYENNFDYYGGPWYCNAETSLTINIDNYDTATVATNGAGTHELNYSGWNNTLDITP